MNPALSMSRSIPAGIDAVWLAWTTEPGLARWWWSSWPDTRYRVNAVVGGEYRIEAAEHGMGVRGVYRVVDRPGRLAFSWIWYDLAEGVASEEPADEVEVLFSAQPGGTLVALTHTGPWTAADAAENYRQGWTFVLDALERTTSGGEREGISPWPRP